MRMTVYGNNATCPEADGACSCFLIEAIAIMVQIFRLEHVSER